MCYRRDIVFGALHTLGVSCVSDMATLLVGSHMHEKLRALFMASGRGAKEEIQLEIELLRRDVGSGVGAGARNVKMHRYPNLLLTFSFLPNLHMHRTFTLFRVTCE